jgi:hypothetical protein
MPEPSEDGDTLYVLDGMQRLITLYATFNGGGGRDSRFDLEFDLEDRRFYHIGKRRGGEAPTRLQLTRVFVPKLFLEDQAKLAKLGKADEWLTQAVYLHSRFQEYQMPVVTIDKASVADAVKIFMNINRGGSDLSTIDFMRALTWHSEFDLNQAVEDIKSRLPTSFRPKDETISKIFALSLGVDPIPDTILNLQKIAVKDLSAAIPTASEAICKVAEFLKKSIGIASADFVPYEGQMLVMTSVFGHAELEEAQQATLMQWFLASSFSEALQGRPDHFVIKLVRESVRAIENGAIDLKRDLVLETGDLARKQIRKGAAVSSGFFSMLALSGARSIFSSDQIEAKDYLEAFDPAKLAPIVAGPGAPQQSAKRLVNLILLSATENYEGKTNAEIVAALFAAPPAVLESQLLDQESVNLLMAKSYTAFFERRAAYIKERVEARLA